MKREARAIHAATAESWNAVASTKYREEFESRLALLRSGRHSLLEVELNELGPFVQGATVIHLQCSHGLDTLSLLTVGAAAVTGVDISSEMIKLAAELAERLGVPARWFCADAIDPPHELDAGADLVYTGKGSLPWIMDLEAWALAIQQMLRPGGSVYILEGHPLDNLWDRQADALRLREDAPGYFAGDAQENAGFPGDAARRAVQHAVPAMRERYWRPDEVMAALGAAGLLHRSYREHPDLYWDQFPNWPDELRSRLPHSYSLRYERPRFTGRG